MVLPLDADDDLIEEDIAEVGTANTVILQKIKRANEDATVVIFEGPDALSETQDKILLKFVLTQSTVVALLPLNIIVNEGKFVQGVTDNDDVHMNILGFYIDDTGEEG